MKGDNCKAVLSVGICQVGGCPTIRALRVSEAVQDSELISDASPLGRHLLVVGSRARGAARRLHALLFALAARSRTAVRPPEYDELSGNPLHQRMRSLPVRLRSIALRRMHRRLRDHARFCQVTASEGKYCARLSVGASGRLGGSSTHRSRTRAGGSRHDAGTRPPVRSGRARGTL
jgi:hypothetical protein